jgi:16S rRNA (cytosine1402-N4)-methyltransferase
MSAHIPVLLEEVVEGLAVQPGGRYIDCTLGGGGHAAAILEHSSPGGQLLGIDADRSAIGQAGAALASYGDSVLLVNDNFVNLESIARANSFQPVHGILFDLGLSSLQLAAGERGFSFQKDAPLDMRFDNSKGKTAADLVNSLSENGLARILLEYGEERLSRQIARQIVQNRPVSTTLQLAAIVEKAAGGRHGKIHPATRTFQALRIAVNGELDNLKSALLQAIGLLGFEGRLAVITYHSLEDRIVKQVLSEESRDCICPPETLICVCGHKAKLKLINRKVITPQAAEIKRNPRSRSAKLRIAERLMKSNEKFVSIGRYYVLTEVKSSGWRKTSVRRNLQKEVLTM